jgi:hypothetical protein
VVVQGPRRPPSEILPAKPNSEKSPPGARLSVIRPFFLGLLVFIGLEQVGGVEEGALFQADVHEGGLDAWQNRFNAAEIDVSNGSPVIRTIHEQFDEPLVLQDRHTGFPLAPVYQDLALQVSTSAARLRGPPLKEVWCR